MATKKIRELKAGDRIRMEDGSAVTVTGCGQAKWCELSEGRAYQIDFKLPNGQPGWHVGAGGDVATLADD